MTLTQHRPTPPPTTHLLLLAPTLTARPDPDAHTANHFDPDPYSDLDLDHYLQTDPTPTLTPLIDSDSCLDPNTGPKSIPTLAVTTTQTY
jgi:hypothetical protein